MEATMIVRFLSLASRLVPWMAAAFCAVPPEAFAASPSPWLQYGHDARLSNVNEKETTLTPSNVALLVPVSGGSGQSMPLQMPAFGHHHMFGASEELGVASVSTRTGQVAWSNSASTATCAPSLTADGTIMTFADVHGMLTAVDTSTGAMLWSRPVYWHPACTTIRGDIVVAVTSNSFTFSFDVRDGGTEYGSSEIQWTTPVELHAAVDGHWYYVVLSDERAIVQIYARERRHQHGPSGWGTLLGNETKGRASSPHIAGDAILVSDSEGGVYAFELDTGAPRWTVVLPTAPGTTPGVTATTATTAYAVSHPAGSEGDVVSALDVASGATAWSSMLPGSAHVHSNLARANGMIFAGTGQDGSCTTLTVLDAASGALIAQVATGMPANGANQCDLAIADGQVALHGEVGSRPVMQLLGLPS
jgi:outer membrane protein assembly factor BamB